MSSDQYRWRRNAAKWEETKKKGEEAVHKWIDDQLTGTSVTVVLIGDETSERHYVGYEIQQSHNKGNGLLGIYIHNMKDNDSKTDTKGTNPFDNWHVTENGTSTQGGSDRARSEPSG